MSSVNRRSLVVIAFTILIIVLVNLSWWLFYSGTRDNFRSQLSHRLAALAHLGASWIKPDLAVSLNDGYLSAYDSTLGILEKIKEADSLSEVFVIDNNYKYLATTLLEADSVYYLAALNAPYIDSLFLLEWERTETFHHRRPIVTEGYRVGDVVLKSAFAPICDTLGTIIAVLGVEADVDYTDVLLDLKRKLYLSTLLSLAAGIIFGFFFVLVQRKFVAAEKSLFISQSQANLGRMVAVVSHEIKNPLMIIRASAERLTKNGMKEADFIVEETDRLNNIVTGYLDFASGKKTLKIEPVDIKNLLGEIEKQCRPRLARDNIKLTVAYSDDDGPVAAADSAALRQVLINLILNGAQACRGRNDGEVNIKYKQESERVEIGIMDNGAGINRKEIKSIFDPFYSTKTTGSGLGLYLSKKLLDQMIGKIAVDSDTGGPTIFTITLPLADKGK